MYQCLHPLSVICPKCHIKLNFLKGSPPFLHQRILSSISVAPSLSSFSMLLNVKHTLPHWNMTFWDYTLNSWAHPSMYYICHLYFYFMLHLFSLWKSFLLLFLETELHCDVLESVLEQRYLWRLGWAWTHCLCLPSVGI